MKFIVVAFWVIVFTIALSTVFNLFFDSAPLAILLVVSIMGMGLWVNSWENGNKHNRD